MIITQLKVTALLVFGFDRSCDIKLNFNLQLLRFRLHGIGWRRTIAPAIAGSHQQPPSLGGLLLQDFR
jgi:hypothetical protein